MVIKEIDELIYEPLERMEMEKKEVTLNIKLPDEVIYEAAQRLRACSAREVSSAIIAALEKMLEIGMATLGREPSWTDYSLPLDGEPNALIIRRDAREKP